MKTNMKVSKIHNFLCIVFIFLSINIFLNSFLYSQSYSWYRLPNSPFGAGLFTDMHFINENTGWFIQAYGNVYKTTDGGTNWIKTDSIETGNLWSIRFFNENTGFAGLTSYSNNLLKTTNGGYEFEVVSKLPGPLPGGVNAIYNIGEQCIFACGRYDDARIPVFVKSTDAGNSWITKDMSQYMNTIEDCYFFDVNTGFLAGGIGEPEVYRGSIILFTTDGGENWIVSYLGGRNREWAKKFCFIDNQNGFVALERFYYNQKYFTKTVNGGLNWITLPYPSFNEASIAFINANTGWIGGIFNPTYGTTDGGNTWFNANIGDCIVEIQFFGDTLGYACGDYIYKYSKTTGINHTGQTLPEEFVLYQNYPNPFNPATKISFELKVSGYVNLIVYDVIGNEVEVLLSEKKNAGNYSVEFDGTSAAGGLSSGVYFYKLEVNSFVMTKRMALLK